jgi:hypothetical protein
MPEREGSRFPADFRGWVDPAPLLAAEADIVAHMNADHADALGLYAEKLAGAKPGQWRASGVDPEGIDLVSGDATARVFFPSPVRTPEEARAILVELVRQARAV